MADAQKGAEEKLTDIEKGAEEGKKKADQKNPFKVLGEALSSKTSFILFVCNPTNFFFVCFAGLAIACTAYLIFHIFADEAMNDNPGTKTEFLAAATVGLWLGALSTLVQATLQDSINRFRALNGRLHKEIEELSQEVNGLQGTSEKLKQQLAEFEGIRGEMQELAEQQGVDFKEFFDNTKGVFDNMTDVQRKQDLVILEQTAANNEWLDKGHGMNFTEFKRFCKQVPERFRSRLEHGMEERFEAVAGDDKNISNEELRAFLKEFVETVEKEEAEAANPQAGAM